MISVVKNIKEIGLGTIITRKQGNKTYYLYHETYREKINKKDYGKTRGSGKSKVCTRSTFDAHFDWPTYTHKNEPI